MPAILFRTPTQVNAKALFQEVHAAEEGVGAGDRAQQIATQKPGTARVNRSKTR